MRMATNRPARKLTMGTIGGSAVAVIAWMLSAFAGVEIPAEAAVALAAVITFVVGYVVEPAPHDRITKT